MNDIVNINTIYVVIYTQKSCSFGSIVSCHKVLSNDIVSTFMDLVVHTMKSHASALVISHSTLYLVVILMVLL